MLSGDFMIATIIISISAIILMFLCILKFPVLRIKGITLDTFFMPLLGAAIILIFLPGFDKEVYFKSFISNSELNPLKILILFISISFLSIALDEAGFFRFIASIFIDKYRKSQYMLFMVLYALISLITIFTSNDIVILTFTPFILYFSKKGNINPIPYLVMEFTAANTWSMVLSIGNPTNIYLSSIFHLDFLGYFLKMIIPAILTSIFSISVLLLLFYKSLSKKIEIFDFEKSKIENKLVCIVAGLHLASTTILLAISNYIHLEMWIICLSFAISLLLFLTIYGLAAKKKRYIKSTIRRAPYSLIPFIISMYTIIMALDSYGIFKEIGKLLQSTDDQVEPLFYLISSTLSCNIVNNIPMTMMYGSILNGTENLKLVYATIMGSNIGALLTPVGALAGIMWMRILKENDIKYTFLDFMKNGLLITSFLILSTGISLFII